MMITLQRVRDGYVYAGDMDLIIMTCPNCGVTYAIPHSLQQNAYERGNRQITWYCPNGHQLGYNSPSLVMQERDRALAQARRATERANAERDLREHTEHKLRSQKGATTKAKKRHAAALCPCYNRSFSQLAQHMTTQHPDYDPSK